MTIDDVIAKVKADLFKAPTRPADTMLIEAMEKALAMTTPERAGTPGDFDRVQKKSYFDEPEML